MYFKEIKEDDVWAQVCVHTHVWVCLHIIFYVYITTYFWVLVFFLDRVYLGSPDYPETSCAEQAGLSLRDLPVSASRMLPLKYAPAGLCIYIHISNAN